MAPEQERGEVERLDARVDKEIAAALKISPRTVEVHKARMMDKLGVGSVDGFDLPDDPIADWHDGDARIATLRAILAVDPISDRLYFRAALGVVNVPASNGSERASITVERIRRCASSRTTAAIRSSGAARPPRPGRRALATAGHRSA